MGDYSTVARLQDYLPGGEDATILGYVLTRASRLIDRIVGVPDDFFAVAGVASNRVFIGTGIQMLKLTPYTTLATTAAVAIEDDDNVPEYRVRDTRYLLRHTDDALWNWGEPDDYDFSRRNARRKPVWPEGKRITVTATWGWAAIPQDIVHGTLELAAVMYWRHPEGHFGLGLGEALGADTIREASIPLRVRLLKAAYANWLDNDLE